MEARYFFILCLLTASAFSFSTNPLDHSRNVEAGLVKIASGLSNQIPQGDAKALLSSWFGCDFDMSWKIFCFNAVNEKNMIDCVHPDPSFQASVVGGMHGCYR